MPLMSMVLGLFFFAQSHAFASSKYSLVMAQVDELQFQFSLCQIDSTTDVRTCEDGNFLYSLEDVQSFAVNMAQVVQGDHQRMGHQGMAAVGGGALLLGISMVSGGTLGAVALGAAGTMSTLFGGAYLNQVDYQSSQSMSVAAVLETLDLVIQMKANEGDFEILLPRQLDDQALLATIDKTLFGIRNKCFSKTKRRLINRCLRSYKKSHEKIVTKFDFD